MYVTLSLMFKAKYELNHKSKYKGKQKTKLV